MEARMLSVITAAALLSFHVSSGVELLELPGEAVNTVTGWVFGKPRGKDLFQGARDVVSNAADAARGAEKAMDKMGDLMDDARVVVRKGAGTVDEVTGLVVEGQHLVRAGTGIVQAGEGVVHSVEDLLGEVNVIAAEVGEVVNRGVTIAENAGRLVSTVDDSVEQLTKGTTEIMSTTNGILRSLQKIADDIAYFFTNNRWAGAAAGFVGVVAMMNFVYTSPALCALAKWVAPHVFAGWNPRTILSLIRSARYAADVASLFVAASAASIWAARFVRDGRESRMTLGTELRRSGSCIAILVGVLGLLASPTPSALPASVGSVVGGALLHTPFVPVTNPLAMAALGVVPAYLVARHKPLMRRVTDLHHLLPWNRGRVPARPAAAPRTRLLHGIASRSRWTIGLAAVGAAGTAQLIIRRNRGSVRQRPASTAPPRRTWVWYALVVACPLVGLVCIALAAYAVGRYRRSKRATLMGTISAPYNARFLY